MDEHKHQRIRYTLEMQARHWWGGRVTYTVIGTASSKKDDELLIFFPDGGLWSVNYTGVYRLLAEPLDEETHSH